MKKRNGRPSKISDVIIGKLEQVFSIDGTIAEACFYANINPDTYHSWIKKDKKLSDRFNAIRNKPNLKARQEVVKGLDGNPEFSLKYLEKKLPLEFGIKQNLEHSGEIKDTGKHEINITEKTLKAIGEAIVKAKNSNRSV